MLPSQWAGAITRIVDDQYQLGMRGLAAHVADRRARWQISSSARAAARRIRAARGRRYTAGVDRGVGGVGIVVLRNDSPKPAAGPCSGEGASCRRGGVGSGSAVESRWAGSGCGATATTSRPADMTGQQWRSTARMRLGEMFLNADGESGNAGGNETIRVEEAGGYDQNARRPGGPARTASGHRRPGAVSPPRRRMRRHGCAPGRRCATTSVYDPDRGPMVSGRILENQLRHRRPSSTTCVAGRCWGWTSMPIIWPRVCSTPRATDR